MFRFMVGGWFLDMFVRASVFILIFFMKGGGSVYRGMASMGCRENRGGSRGDMSNTCLLELEIATLMP